MEIEERHKNEIESIEQKIKKSFMRKDEIIRKLQDDVDKKDLAIKKYEELLNQQRKELFGKQNYNSIYFEIMNIFALILFYFYYIKYFII